MDEIPEDDLEQTRAALAPMLDATAALLPWLNKAKPARFDAKLNARWIEAFGRLATAWSERHLHGLDAVRPAIFGLYAVAIESGDADCLGLGEALASAADRLEDETPPPQLIAALSSTLESLNDPAGLEHEALGERARHFAARLEHCAVNATPGERSAILDRLFVQEAREHLELLQDALAALPPDAYALTTESAALAQQAELAELWGIMHLARQLRDYAGQHAAELDNPAARQTMGDLLRDLDAAIATVDG